MNQERAILHFNKFKALKNMYVRDTLKGATFKITKVKLFKNSETDYEVKVHKESEIDQSAVEVDSNYAYNNFKAIN